MQVEKPAFSTNYKIYKFNIRSEFVKNVINFFSKKEYFKPNVEITVFDCEQDVIRVSGDANDNDFGAGGLKDGGFVDEN